MATTENKNIKILSENLFPVVGVGASAGGMDAFKSLVRAIPKESGMAFILIQHLAPQYESILADLLQKVTTIPVVEITDNIKVVPNHIYVIPSNQVVTANDGILQLEQRVEGERVNTIDVFFTSLAEIHQDHAIGVVLSGTGNDGTVGLKTIKDQGGITVAQDEASAAYFAMPKSAIDAEVVDFVLSPDVIADHLIDVIRSSQLSSPDLNISVEIQEETTFQQIITLLKARHNIDFTYYKQTTIRRRILRRKALSRVEKLIDYYTFLLENKEEQDALFKDILIPVTAFFRDPKTFDILCETIFQQLFKEKIETEPIRIWVAGCSSGEEAYSIAICLHEYFGDAVQDRKIQIFATDVSEGIISKARSGIYQKKDMAGISDSRIRKFFTRIDGSYHVNKEIRQMCVFACHNFLKDPPFAKVDLISCRNVLIYMEPYLQKRAFATFNYALNNKGFLLLGKSESPGPASELFQQASQHEKIYVRKPTARKNMQVESKGNETALKRKDDHLKSREAGKDDFGKAADEALLAKYASVGVIVNEQLDILQFRGITSAYLEAPPGKASHNILTMAREGLAFELRNALHKAKERSEAIKKTGIPVGKEGRHVDIEIIPLQNTIDPYFLVLFKEASEEVTLPDLKRSKKRKNEDIGAKSAEALRIEHLEKELSQLREDMRAITENQEAANEELQSANEELLSSSEELQSLNEELETGKEEIQSSNEELTSLNQELIERNEQLIYARKYAEAIVTTIHEPLLILTKDFQIKSANKCFYEKFAITEKQTVGKLFFEWNEGIWNVSGLRELLQKVLPDRSYFENFEVEVNLLSIGKRHLSLNARQIINNSSSEQLILVALQDITNQKAFDNALEQQVYSRTQELQEANVRLQQSNENLRQFASIASHDLQEPLRKIKTFSSILSRRFGKNVSEEENELIYKINRAVDRMSQLIIDVLEFSKMANSTKDYVPTNLDTILLNVLNDLELIIAEKDVDIQYAELLPTIDAIPLQMNQLFSNLITNALKFHSSNSKPTIAISFKVKPASEFNEFPSKRPELSYIEIKFRDNGIGFDPEFAEQIFQLFERLHSVDEYEGTGLGLAICKKITENHNGEIYAISSESEGACFYVILPVIQDATLA